MFESLKKEVQEVIDAIARKEYRTANSKIEFLNTKIEELMDTNANDDFLREISKYQILVEHLHNKINTAE